MKKNILLFFVLLPFSINCFSQLEFGVKVNGGFSRISNSLSMSNGTVKPKLTISGQGGMYLDYKLNDKIVIGVEALFIQIEGKEVMEIDLINEYGIKTGIATDNLYMHISYVGIPIYCGMKIKKTTINIGVQYLYAIKSSAREIGQGDGYSWDNKFKDVNIIKYNYGPKISIFYNLTNKLEIEANYYYGLNNILKIMDWKRKIQQMTIGLRYKFF